MADEQTHPQIQQEVNPESLDEACSHEGGGAVSVEVTPPPGPGQ